MSTAVLDDKKSFLFLFPQQVIFVTGCCFFFLRFFLLNLLNKTIKNRKIKTNKKLHRKFPLAPSAGGLFWLGSGMRFLQNVQPSFSGTGRRRHPMQSKTGIRPSFSCY